MTEYRWDVLNAKEYEDKTSGDKKSFWLKMGSAFDSKDGNSITVELQGLPVDGRLVLRRPKPRDEA
jgi:hypothetical protein